MQNREGFHRDVALFVEFWQESETKDAMAIDSQAIELAHDYAVSMVDVWYAIAHHALA